MIERSRARFLYLASRQIETPALYSKLAVYAVHTTFLPSSVATGLPRPLGPNHDLVPRPLN